MLPICGVWNRPMRPDFWRAGRARNGAWGLSSLPDFCLSCGWTPAWAFIVSSALLPRAKSGTGASVLPADGFAFILGVEPFLEGGEVIADGGGVHLAGAGDFFEGLLPGAAGSSGGQGVVAVAGG